MEFLVARIYIDGDAVQMVFSILGAPTDKKQTKRERRRLDTIKSRKDLLIQNTGVDAPNEYTMGRASALFT